ncbi:MAG: metal ABC transporter substrate-binding protein [Lachnospiraceae bacterium]|nr:metal ABC transporter substrate-binding protein [Lachnospiraceae bacterium]
MEKNKDKRKRPELGLKPLLAAILIILAIFLIVLYLNRPEKKNAAKGTIVCTFFPVYDVVNDLMEGTGYDVINMTSGVSGCIHDYQITTKDMKALEKADLFVANGMGMEHFLENVAKNFKNLPVVYMTDAFEEAQPMNRAGHVEDEVNAHLWMDPEAFLEEIEYLETVLCKRFPDAAERITSNKNRYSRDAIDAKDKAKEMSNLYSGYADPESAVGKIYAISFNESFEVLAEKLEIEIIAGFSLDENEQPSAGEVAEAIAEAKNIKNVLVLIEEDKKAEADKILNETDAKVVYLSSLTSGKDADGLPKGIWKNLIEIETVVDTFIEK